jgi:hypothetical protein
VDDFVVAQGENEILVMMIEHREGEIVLVILAIDGILLEVAKRVVHPAHVPLEAEAESAEVRRARDLRPGGGFLGDGDDAGMFGVDDVIEMTEEIDGFEVFASAELVGNPLALLAAVVEVEHGGDGIDAKRSHQKRAFAVRKFRTSWRP